MANNISNANTDFHDIGKCDFTKHWSFSLFFRNLAILDQINKLPPGARVMEVGAADSYLSEYLRNNIGRIDIEWIKIDVNPKYHDSAWIMDISKVTPAFNLDLVIAAEVIEHMETKELARDAIENMFESLHSDGKLILTTPTPISGVDDLVWPDSHDYEFSFDEIYSLVNEYFEIIKAVPWSMKEREYNTSLATDPMLSRIYSIMRGAYPESLIRSVVSLLCDNKDARQTILIAQKRRVKNARPAQTL